MKKKTEKYLGPESRDARVEVTFYGDFCQQGCWEIRETNGSGSVQLKPRYELRPTAHFKYEHYLPSGGYFRWWVKTEFVTIDCTLDGAFDAELAKWQKHFDENAERREQNQVDTENFEKNGPKYSDGNGTSMESDGFWNK